MRPPKPSSKEAIISKPKEPKNDKHIFRQKVDSSNQTAICTASTTQVGRLTIKDLLKANKYHVPIFQRRYCWTPVQWNTILMDARKGKDHSLGRLTCTNNISDERSCILDGQQRFTTITILLASMRDSIINSGHRNHPLVQSINELLFIDVNAMKEYDVSNLIHGDDLSEGIELPFTRLIPTFCDRVSYYASILPKEDENKRVMPQIISKLEENISWNRALQAKHHFDNKLRQINGNTKKLVSLAHSILNKFNMLYFPITIDGGYEDGTEDLMVVYERLALRDATFCRPKRQQEYVSMSSSDMIRNLLLGSFSTKENAVDFYKHHWLPLEQLSVQRYNSHHRDDSMNILIQSFLKRHGFYNGENPLNGDPNKTSHFGMGGKLYADFQIWLSDFMRKTRDENNAIVYDSDQMIIDVGIKLHDFVYIN